MNIHKCINCKHYDSFFGSCDLYYEEVYMNEGDFDIRSVSIRNVNKSECQYELKRITDEKHYN